MTDSRFEELERKCKRINMKIFFKFFSFFLLLFTFTIIYFYDFLDLKNKIYIKDKNESKTKLIIKNDSKSKNLPNSHLIKPKLFDDENRSLNQKKSSEREKKKKKVEYDTIFLSPTINIPDNIEKPKPNKNNKIEDLTNTLLKKNSEKKIIIKIKHKKISSDSDNVIKSSDYEKNLYMATESFKNRKYTKAIYYAKKASQILPQSKEPWLIYIKSKIAQGKKDEAIVALQTFLSYYSSEEAEIMLKKLRGKN